MASPSRGATLIVTNTADSGDGSLRDAINVANPGDTIVFTNTLSGQTIYLTSGELLLENSLTIDASSLSNRVIIDGGGNFRVIEIAGPIVTLNSLTLTNGVAPSETGAGILVDSDTTLTANDCLLFGNSASSGGALCNNSMVTLNRCVLSGNASPGGPGGAVLNIGSLILNQVALSNNTAVGYGGAIENDGVVMATESTLSDNVGGGGGAIDNNSTVVAVQCTFFGNTTVENPGSVIWAGGSNLLINCTLAGNLGDAAISQYADAPILLTNTVVASNPDGNIDGSFVGSNNFTSGDPQLASLGNYGGFTPTMPPLQGSPVIDGGDDSITNSLTTDQRGRPRLAGAHVDIGAVEAQPALPGNAPLLTNASRVGGNAFQFGFTNAPGADFTALTSTNVTLPISNWTALGHAMEISPGQYQFTDPGATNSRQRFYRIASP